MKNKLLGIFSTIFLLCLVAFTSNIYATEVTEPGESTETESSTELPKENQKIKISKKTFLIEADDVVGDGHIDLSEYISAKTALSYSKVKSNSKKLSISPEGIITVASTIEPGSYKLTLRITAEENDQYLSAEKTQKFTIKANTAAGKIIISLDGDENTIVLLGEDYIESGCHATDKKEGNITDSVTISGQVDTSKAGSYSVIYSATNSKGEQMSRLRTVNVVKKLKKDTNGVPVIMYHYVYTQNTVPANLNANYILDTKLESQLAWLKANDFYFPSYEELAAYVAGTHSLPDNSVILTFDDGEIGFLKYGIPLLEKYQIPATSFIICDRSTSKAKIRYYSSPYVTFQSHSYGMHIGGPVKKGHGGMIFSMTEKEIIKDLRKAQKLLGTTEAFAYPYGDVSDLAPSAVSKANILCAFTTAYGRVHPGDNPQRLSRVRMSGESAWTAIKTLAK